MQSKSLCKKSIRMGNLNGWMRALLYLFLMLAVIVRLRICDAADSSDTLSLGSSLRGNQTMKSKNGTFELGFFEPNGTNKWYIAMWYAQVSEKTIVWVANREKPVEKAPGVFNLTEDGNLVLFDAEGSRIWSSNATKKASAAVLQDSGNFVLTAENSSESVWQSFDLPGNTWLPGMKISVKQKLTSWKNSWDPTPGTFSLQMDRSGATQYVLLWKSSKQYWESGDWNGQFFSKVPEMIANYTSDFDFSFSFNDTVREDMYFTYSVKPQSKLISRFVLNKAGRGFRCGCTPTSHVTAGVRRARTERRCCLLLGKRGDPEAILSFNPCKLIRSPGLSPACSIFRSSLFLSTLLQRGPMQEAGLLFFWPSWSHHAGYKTSLAGEEQIFSELCGVESLFSKGFERQKICAAELESLFSKGFEWQKICAAELSGTRSTNCWNRWQLFIAHPLGAK